MAVHAGDKYGIVIAGSPEEIIQLIENSQVLNSKACFSEGERQKSHPHGMGIIADTSD
jgi:hypothetical protein